MNDFNRGALPAPCLRLDYGSGEQWESIELGDGTGYVRLAEYEKVVSENAKLRKLVQSLYRFSFDEYPDGTELNFANRLRELGVEVCE